MNMGLIAGADVILIVIFKQNILTAIRVNVEMAVVMPVNDMNLIHAKQERWSNI